MKKFLKESKSIRELPEHSEDSPLSIHSMTISYNYKPVLWDVEYEAPQGSLIAIIGPNGAGKTTLIKGALGLIPRASGEVSFWGKSYNEIRDLVGYVPQRESVDWTFPISALEVVQMGRYSKIGWIKRVSKKHRDIAYSYLETVGMEKFANRQISQLSGGQQQRVFIARALAQEAQLYFMDEPFAGVDAATETAIVEMLKKLRDEGKTVICVHHDLSSVEEYFDSVVLLNTRIISYGSTKSTLTQENLRKTYGGRLTILDQVSSAIEKATS